MKSLLVFIPHDFNKQKPGCMFGNISTENDITKFYVLGLTESVQSITKANNNLLPLGYFYGIEKKSEYWEKKLPNWIEIYLLSQTNNDNEYYVRNIILENQKVLLSICQTVIILYDEYCLLRAELYMNKVPQDNFLELRKILKKEAIRKNQERLQKSCSARMKESMFSILVLTFLYPIMWLCKATSFFSPILKHSTLGLHLNTWMQNANWALSTILQNKRLSLMTINYILAVAIDIFLGRLSLKLLLNFLDDSLPSETLLFYAEHVVETLKDLVNWLMGSPAGLKLNRPFNNVLGKFFLYHIHLWWAFLRASKPLMKLAFKILFFFGRFGITFQISIVADLLALVSFHTYCIYVYAARLFNVQVRGLTALFRLFLGKKKNPLRQRIDSCQYKPDQLFLGTLLFTILLFLMPTTWVYYTVFTMLRLVMIGLGGLLTKLRFYLQIMPAYTIVRWLFHTVDATGSIGIHLLDRQTDGPIIIKTKAIILSWSETWKKSIPETIKSNPPIKWNKIISDAFWGQLLYPF